MNQIKQIEFDIDKKNLLKDVISKQTGSLNKAIKELFQNSFDSGATEIKLSINTKGLRFTDNGKGMSFDEINKYFRVFGATLKRDDGTKTGAFGMGRGQIFNFGKVLWRTQNYAMIIDINKSLDYLLLETNKFVKGTDIVISFYKELYSWKIGGIYYDVKKDILPPKNININIENSIYKPSIKEFEDFSNDDYLVFTSSNHINRIYNGGLSVKYIKHSNYNYSVMPYKKLELNFARNELIENAESTRKLNKFIDNIEELMASQKGIFDYNEAVNILKLLGDKRIRISTVYNKRIIPLSNGKLISFKELIEKPNMGVVFGKKNIWSDDCLRNDYKVISYDIQFLFKRIKTLFDLNIDFLDKDTREISRRGFYKDAELHSLTRNKMYFYIAVELNEYIFSRLMMELCEEVREIHLGLSDVANAWTNPYKHTIHINKSYIQNFQTKEEAIICLWKTLCHEYAHDSKNTEQDYHSQNFYEQFEDNITKTAKLVASALKYITRKYIKEKYEY